MAAPRSKNMYTRMCHVNKMCPYDAKTLSQVQGRSASERSLLAAHSNHSSHSSTHRGRATERHCPQAPLTEFSTVERAKRGGVTFKSTATVWTYSSGNDGTTQEGKSRLYYSRDEINIFNLEAHAACAPTREPPRIRDWGTHLAAARESMIPLEEEDSLRGLELLLYPRRRWDKILARRSFLGYQDILNSRPNVDGERRHLALAAASARLNALSSLLAVETARLDAMRAREGDHPMPDDAPRQTAGVSPLPPCEERRLRSGPAGVGADGDGRSAKRRRIEQR